MSGKRDPIGQWGASSALLLTDYAGHPFTYELAVALRDKGLDATYSYCSNTTAPNGPVDDGRCPTFPVGSPRPFDKYNLFRRALSEVRYGVGTARVVKRVRPETHVVCNMPLLSLLIIWLAALRRRCRLVVWFQDVQSGLASSMMGDSLPTRAISALESFLLRHADRVIAISPEIETEARRRGVQSERLGVLGNWAPIEAIPVRPKDNPWSRRHGLHERLTFLYSGTLARKHNPEMLRHLATALHSRDGVVVVVSEGEGADWLSALGEPDRPENLLILPYQPFEALPDVLGSADVLVVLLEATAGQFSVPSKTLSYLCAERPIVAAMPSNNAAARMIRDDALAGIVVASDADEALCAASLELADDPERRSRLGRAGRNYADNHFTRTAVVDNFLSELPV